MVITEEKKKNYAEKVRAEMQRRGLTDEEIPRVIDKTGFMAALNEYPEEQLHYSVSDAVDEILVTAARR